MLVRLHLWLLPSKTEFGYQNADLILEKDRRMKPIQESLKSVGNFLASAALEELVGDEVDWRSLSVKELQKEILKRESPIVQNGH